MVHGLVSESKPGYARVKLETYDDVVTDWLPIIKPRAMNDDMNWPLEVNEQVTCVVDAYCQTGVVLGATSNDEDEPDDEAGEGKLRLKFSDGAFFEYDKTAHVMKMLIGSTEVEVSGSLAKVKVGSTELEISGSETKVEMGTTKLTMSAAGHKIEAGGKDLGATLQSLVSHIQALVLITPSGPGSIDPSSIAQLTLDAVDLALVLP